MITFHTSTEKLSRLLFSIFIGYVIIFDKTTTHARVLPYLWIAPYTSEKPDDFIHGTSGRGNAKLFGYIQFIPNGILMQRSIQNTTNLQKPVFDAVRLNLQQDTSNNKWDIKIYGEGTEHKFPPFLESIIQRIQTYFSIYKYTDTSALGSLSISLDKLTADNIRMEENFPPLDTKLVGNGNNNLTQPINILNGESTVQETNAELIEFITIGEYNDD